MEDAAEQQAMEIEALESILMDDLEEVTDYIPSGWRPAGKVYRVVLLPKLDDQETNSLTIRAEIVFAHTSNYPDQPPLLKARSLHGLTDADVAHLQAALDEQIDENEGIPMIFQAITAAQDWMNDRAVEAIGPTIDPDAERRKALEEEERRIAELRAHGTPVTPETFAEWRVRFEAEMAMERAKLQGAGPLAGGGTSAVDEVVKQRLTGRHWFMQQDKVEEPEYADDAEWSEPEELEEDVYIDEVDFEDSEDEEEMLEEFLQEKTA